MGGQRGGMTNEAGSFPEVCKKSIQAMAADMQGGIRPHFFSDFSLEKLRGLSSRELEAAGRLTQPMYAGPLDSTFRAIAWDEAIARVVAKLAKTIPDESFFYLSGRSSNEAGFLLQLFARVFGTNNVSNCSYYCHQASGVALASVIGSGIATVALDDIEKCDLLVLIGCNPASNHPRLMSDLVRHKRRGGKVVVINPMKEIGLVRFRVPSDPRSLLFGSTIADLYVQPHIGGDVALLSGVAKRLIERDQIDRSFIEMHTEGWPEFEAAIRALEWDTILAQSGVSRDTIDEISSMCAHSKSSIFCWTMGITHHAHGVENVQMIANLALMRGMIGGRGKGLLPLRGHSNVQGMGSIGATPALREPVFARLEKELGIELSRTPGMDTLASVHAADEGCIRFAFHLGGNLYGSNPDSLAAARALSKVDMTVFLSTSLNTGHIWGRGRETVILPVLARDEEEQSTTQESMFSFVRLSDGGPRRHEGPRSETAIISEIAARLAEEKGCATPIDWTAFRNHQRVRELIARVVPEYQKVGEIESTRVEFHIPGRLLREPQFPTPSGRARFHPVPPPSFPGGAGFRLMTIRSEGQFNTVVYEDADIYRGQERRDVILMSRDDIERLGLRENDRVTVRSEAGALGNVLVREFAIRPGNCAMYYPEANALVSSAHDPRSKTPSFKNTRVEIEREAARDRAIAAPLDSPAVIESNGKAKRTLRAC
jgi:molybdopterin-dependent oxidoreductase alpha subunit